MQKQHALIALLAAALSFAGCSQPVFVEETGSQPGQPPTEESHPTDTADDGHTYDRLEWQGETEKFRFEADGTIRLYDDSEKQGTAYLSAPLSTPDRTCWQVHVNLSFNPSANNYARLYLMADSPDLTGSLHGYFLQVGGEKDCLYFYRQEGTHLTLLHQTDAFMQGDSSPETDLKVERDSQGYFLLHVPEAGTPAQPVAIVKDTVVATATHCGISCTYTGSRSRGMRFPVFRIHHDVTDVEEVQPDHFYPSQPTE